MTLTARILLGFAVIGGLSFYFLLDRVMERIERQYLEAAEEPMVDAAYLLAGLASEEWPQIAAGKLPSWADGVGLARAADPHARIFTKLKDRVEMDFYIAGKDGVILYDSSGQHAPGSNYAAFLDVARTLRGLYGARSSRAEERDLLSSVMYVGAPIRVGDEIVGCLSVFKPQRSLHAFIRETRRALWWSAAAALAAMLLGGLLASRWITSPVRALTGYAEAVARGEKPKRPSFASRSMDELADAFERMRDAAQGKDAIESYVQTLTHEMKSPVAAIRGASELLAEPMPETQRQRFLANIRSETERLAKLTEGLLTLSAVERRKELGPAEPIDPRKILDQVAADIAPSAQIKGLRIRLEAGECPAAKGDPALVKLAIGNLLQNAVDFSPHSGRIFLRVSGREGSLRFEIEDEGPGIPDFARARIFERFYSLPRTGGGKKSTGLGLCFAREAALLHGGSCSLECPPGKGTLAIFEIPAA